MAGSREKGKSCPSGTEASPSKICPAIPLGSFSKQSWKGRSVEITGPICQKRGERATRPSPRHLLESNVRRSRDRDQPEKGAAKLSIGKMSRRGRMTHRIGCAALALKRESKRAARPDRGVIGRMVRNRLKSLSPVQRENCGRPRLSRPALKEARRSSDEGKTHASSYVEENREVETSRGMRIRRKKGERIS